MANAIQIEADNLDAVGTLAKNLEFAINLEIMERPLDLGAYTIYCTLVYVDVNGSIHSIYRKLQPTCS